jgi:hypothetical protein
MVLLDAPALYSKAKIRDLLDPATRAKRSAAESHHLFPRGYLKKQGINRISDVNQIANRAFVEWHDNSDISDQSPADYVPALEKRLSEAELRRHYQLHALPVRWYELDYQAFLQQRRERIAAVIHEGYRALLAGPADETGNGFDLRDVLDVGESDQIEFKSTLRTNLHTRQADKRMEHGVLKSIAAFLNGKGGTLVIGVSDDGTPAGLEADGFANEDKMGLHLVNLIKDRLGHHALTRVHPHFDDHDGIRVLVIECQPAREPVFLKDGNDEAFFVRTGPSSTQLPPSQITTFVRTRFSD